MFETLKSWSNCIWLKIRKNESIERVFVNSFAFSPEQFTLYPCNITDSNNSLFFFVFSIQFWRCLIEEGAEIGDFVCQTLKFSVAQNAAGVGRQSKSILWWSEGSSDHRSLYGNNNFYLKSQKYSKILIIFFSPLSIYFYPKVTKICPNTKIL